MPRRILVGATDRSPAVPMPGLAAFSWIDGRPAGRPYRTHGICTFFKCDCPALHQLRLFEVQLSLRPSLYCQAGSLWRVNIALLSILRYSSARMEELTCRI